MLARISRPAEFRSHDGGGLNATETPVYTGRLNPARPMTIDENQALISIHL